MQIKQVGPRVFLSRCILLIVIVSEMIVFSSLIYNVAEIITTQDFVEQYLVSLLLGIIFLGVFLIPTWFLLWQYADIVLKNDGIIVRTCIGITEYINWCSIKETQQIKNIGVIILWRTNRKIVFNTFYGNGLGLLNTPVILLSICNEDYEHVRSMIEKNIPDVRLSC